jgi:hypothetical protein
VTSGDPITVARCGYCGKEFDVRRFQVVVVGSRGPYDSTECARLDAEAGTGAPRRIRAVELGSALKRR